MPRGKGERDRREFNRYIINNDDFYVRPRGSRGMGPLIHQGPPRYDYGPAYRHGPPHRGGRFNQNEDFYEPYEYYGKGANMQYGRSSRYEGPPSGFRGNRIPQQDLRYNMEPRERQQREDPNHLDEYRSHRGNRGGDRLQAQRYNPNHPDEFRP